MAEADSTSLSAYGFRWSLSSADGFNWAPHSQLMVSSASLTLSWWFHLGPSFSADGFIWVPHSQLMVSSGSLTLSWWFQLVLSLPLSSSLSLSSILPSYFLYSSFLLPLFFRPTSFLFNSSFLPFYPHLLLSFCSSQSYPGSRQSNRSFHSSRHFICTCCRALGPFIHSLPSQTIASVHLPIHLNIQPFHLAFSFTVKISAHNKITINLSSKYNTVHTYI